MESEQLRTRPIICTRRLKKKVRDFISLSNSSKECPININPTIDPFDAKPIFIIYEHSLNDDAASVSSLNVNTEIELNRTIQ